MTPEEKEARLQALRAAVQTRARLKAGKLGPPPRASAPRAIDPKIASGEHGDPLRLPCTHLVDEGRRECGHTAVGLTDAGPRCPAHQPKE